LRWQIRSRSFTQLAKAPAKADTHLLDLRPAATPAASTGRTRDRTRPMLQKYRKVPAKAPSTCALEGTVNLRQALTRSPFLSICCSSTIGERLGCFASRFQSVSRIDKPGRCRAFGFVPHADGSVAGYWSRLPINAHRNVASQPANNVWSSLRSELAFGRSRISS
jgi:hypothetical protein